MHRQEEAHGRTLGAYLVDSIVKLQLGGLAGAVGARECAGAVGGAAAHLVVAEQRGACSVEKLR